MPFTNTSFEAEGAEPGFPLDWTILTTDSGELFAEFGTSSPKLDVESFEAEWMTLPYHFAFDPLTDTVAPLFDTAIGEGQTFEDFEHGWSMNHGYSFVMGSIAAALFGDVLELESFEVEWENDDYAFSADDVSYQGAEFGVALIELEDFEVEWSNDAYDYGMGSTVAATFGPGAITRESFESTYGPALVSSIAYGTSTFTLVGHGLANGDVVRVRAATDAGLLPSPLQVDTDYFVIGVAGATFQLSGSSGGSAVTLTPAGTGVIITRDPSEFWPVDGPA